MAQELRTAPARLYSFDRASLRDVIRFLAEDAGIPFILSQETMPGGQDVPNVFEKSVTGTGTTTPSTTGAGAAAGNQTTGGATGGTGAVREGSTTFSLAKENSTFNYDEIPPVTLVTFTMRAAPFVVLEAIARAYDIKVSYENGVWVLRRSMDMEMTRRLETTLKVQREIERFNQMLLFQEADANRGGDSTNALRSALEQKKLESLGLNNLMEGRNYVLRHVPQDRVEFESGATTSSSTTSQTGSASIPNLTTQTNQSIYKSQIPPIVNEIRSLIGLPPVTEDGATPPSAEGQPSVTYFSDSNSLFIIATAQQHSWIEEFLRTADRPQPLIGIEVKFFETTKDPQKDLGVNWAGTLQNGFRFSATNMTFSPSGTVSMTTNNEQLRRSGQLPPGDSPYDYFTGDRKYQATVAAPYSAVLSTSDVAFTINAFMQDRETSIVQYPRVLTVNNREVAISNAINQPILGSTQQSQTGGSTQTTNTVDYLPIGTQLNILPKVMPDNSVNMNVAITVSSLVAETRINTGTGENIYPVTSSRIYQAALQVDSGYTLAVGGLEEATDRLDKNGIPLLQDIPGVGELFKNKGRKQNKKNLIVFITPTVIMNRTETTGVAESPSTTLPVRPGSVPRAPAFTPDGNLVGGINALADAIRWLQYQLRYYQQIKDEVRVDQKTQTALRGIINTAMMIQAQIPSYAIQQPGNTEYLGNSEATLESIIRDLNRLRSRSRREIIY